MDVQAQQLTIAGHLIAAGADVNKCNKRVRRTEPPTTVHIVATYLDPPRACSLCVCVVPSVVQGMSAVHVASLRGWPAAVDYLVRNGANVNKAGECVGVAGKVLPCSRRPR